jgi:hypothetical protein
LTLKANLSRIYLSLAVAEGFLALVWIFAIPSEPSSVYILGQSKARLALAVITAILWLVTIAICVHVYHSQSLRLHIPQALDQATRLCCAGLNPRRLLLYTFPRSG